MAQTVVIGGLKSPFYITNGYGPAAPINITLSPFAPVVAVLSVTHFTVNIAANWVLTGSGTLVVAGDNLSADYTAPASATTPTLKVTSKTDPGNTLTSPIFVTAFGALTKGDVVPPGAASRSIIEA